MKSIKITCDGTDYVDYKTLVPFQGHLKILSEDNLEKLKKSIIKYGFTVPAFIWQSGKKKYILDAHQRQIALSSLAEDGYIIPNIPIVYIKAKNKTEAKEKLLHITSQYGEFDKDGLEDFLLSLDSDDDFMDTLRLVNNEIDMSIFEEPEAETVNDDELPEKVKTITKLGDLWELGNHRLLCGDSTDKETVEKLMNGQKADMVFTDPPYNVAFNGRSGKFEVIKNDNLSEEQFESFIGKFLKVLKDSKVNTYYLCCNWKFYGLMQLKLKPKSCIVWAKNVFGLGRGYRHQHEFILFDGFIDPDIKNESDLWEIKRDTNYQHPTQKPVQLPERAIINSSKAGNIIQDYFCGSGPVFIAAEKTNRICYGMELDLHYCDVIVTRYRNWCEANGREPIIKRNGKKQ